MMELLALLAGLGKLKNRDMPVVVVSKSQYALSGIGGDLVKWKAKGWRKADGKTRYNLPQHECMVLVQDYSATLRTKIIDRWAEPKRDTHRLPTKLR